MSSDMDMSPDANEPVIMTPSMDADAPTNDSMSMPPQMDMGPDRTESLGGPGTKLNAMRSHPRAMSPKLDGVTECFARTMKVAGAGAMRDHSSTFSSCKHEPCSQTSISASPPTGDHSQRSSILWIRSGISNPINLWTKLRWTGAETSPPDILAAAYLTATLRI